MKEILQTKFTPKIKYQKVVLIKLASLMLEAKYPNAIADVGKWMTRFSFFESLSHRILGRDSRKGGEGCNTPGVSHELSSGFGLK